MSTAADTPCVILGSGLDALVAAVVLARRGWKSLILEPAQAPFGIHRSETIIDGFRTAGLLDDSEGVQNSVLRALGFRSHSGILREAPLPHFIPEPKGAGLCFGEPAPAVVTRLKHRPGTTLPEYERWLSVHRHARRLAASIVDGVATDLEHPLRHHVGHALASVSTRKEHRIAFARALPMSLLDHLDDAFSDPLLKAALACHALLGTPYGPRAAGTTLYPMLLQALRTHGVVGGTTALAARALNQALSLGCELRLGQDIKRILIRNNRVTDVLLSSGQRIATTRVLSTIDPKKTIFELLEPRERPPELADLCHWKCNGNVGVVHFALRERPRFLPYRNHVFHRLTLVESMEQLESAARSVKHGDLPGELPLHIRVPSVEDPSLAPDGQHVMTVLFSPIPYGPIGGWPPAWIAALKNQVLTQLNRAAPDLQGLILGEQWLLPRDLEERYGLTGGHLFGGDLTLDQFHFLRPHPLLAQGATPVEGLYLAGPGLHPGGHFPGASGLLTGKRMRSEP